MRGSVYRRIEELEAAELDDYTSMSWQIMIYVAVGTAIGFIFDRIGYSGYLPEAVVRAIAGTADTMGLMFAAIAVVSVRWLRSHSNLAHRLIKDMGRPLAVTWIIGGLIGLGLAFVVQALVFKFADDPYGPWGVTYAFAFSNLDNAIAGLTVLLAALANHGRREGWTRYWRHPFFIGNAIMLVAIPTVAVLVRILAQFRPELNVLAGLEAGIMDVDSVGAAVIFLIATKLFNVRVPAIDDDLQIVERVRRLLK